MKIAHLSDLHLFSSDAIKLIHLIGRRLFGAVNLFITRHNLFSEDVARLAIHTIIEQHVDHVIITGDMTNLALEAEFELAKSIVSPIGGYEKLTVVPGNHDYYTPSSVKTQRFEKYFGYTLWRDGKDKFGQYPVIKDLEGIRIVGVRTATVSPPACAFGFIGEQQGLAIRAALEEALSKDMFTILALHHNLHRRPMINELTGKLLDRWRIYEILKDTPADLVLHGHDHESHSFDSGNTKVIGCGSSSRRLPNNPGTFNILEINGKKARIQRWRLLPDKGMFAPIED